VFSLKTVVILYGQLVGAGGAERVAIEEAKYFRRVSKAKLLTFRVKEEALFGHKGLPELEVIGWKGANKAHANYKAFFSSLSRVIALRARLRQLSPSLVVGCCWAGWLELYLATLFTSVPYVLHLHGSLFWLDKNLMKYSLIHKSEFDEIRESVVGHKEFVAVKPKLSIFQRLSLEFLALLDYFAVRRAKAVFVLSNQMRWEVNKLYKRDAIVLPIGPISLQLSNYTPQKDVRKILKLQEKKVILSISRLDHRKRIVLLIRAFAVLSKDDEDAVLVIGGKGPEEVRLKKLAKDLGVQDRVKFVGFVDEKDIWDYYAACDVFAYPGWADYAITVYEALALQKKVVCSSEMEIESRLLASGHVFKTYPSVEAFAKTLKEALSTEVKTNINPNEYTWDKYFDKVRSFSDL
jgi:glycosyltransferase involved in cell wall biosynthesis